MKALFTVAAAAALAACTSPEQETLPLIDRDVDVYAADIQPVVGPGCGSLDCHGDAERPLRLFAEYGRRADRSLRGQPLTAEEIADNVAAFAAMPAARVLDKPLHESAGGMAHVGGDLWPGAEDPEYRCVAAWLAGEPTDACAEARALAPY